MNHFSYCNYYGETLDFAYLADSAEDIVEIAEKCDHFKDLIGNAITVRDIVGLSLSICLQHGYEKLQQGINEIFRTCKNSEDVLALMILNNLK